MTVPATGIDSELLDNAIALGKSGDRERAYRCLAEYHRSSLIDEWLFQRNRILAQEEHDDPHRQTAEALLCHRITTWHTTTVQFGEEIDWNYDRTDKYGFHYLGWLTPGIKRFMETGNSEYRHFLIRTINSYYRSRNSLTHTIPHLHPVYYELGAWAKWNQLLPIYLELLHTGDVPAETHEALMKLFLGFARSLYRLQRGYRGGNWQIVGCSGLLALARVFPEFSEKAAWERRAVKYLLAHVENDFYADGCHKERCWGYGFMSLHGLVSAWQVANRHGGLGRHEAPVLRRIRQAFRWFAKTLGPNELKPEYGDCKLDNGSTILDAARPFFIGRDRYLGVDRSISYLLKPSGYVVMRNGDAPGDAYLNISFGPFRGWHSHYDTLNLNFWARGEPLIEEMGRFGGYGEALSCLFRAPESHNVLTIDGMHFDNTDIENRRGRDLVWYSTPRFDFFSAWHQAYRAHPLEPQAIDACVRRTVLFIKDAGYALVHDAAWEFACSGEGPNLSITQNWHSPFPFQAVSPGMVRTIGHAACLLLFPRPEELRRVEPGIDFAGPEAPAEGDYPERYYLRARVWKNIDHRGASGIAILLYPFSGPQPDISITPLPLSGAVPYRADAFTVTTSLGQDVIVLNPDMLAPLSFEGMPIVGHGLVSLGNGRGEAVIP